MRRREMKKGKKGSFLLIFCLIMLTACNGMITKRYSNTNNKPELFMSN